MHMATRRQRSRAVPTSGRRTTSGTGRSVAARPPRAEARDEFFRHIVSNMRNGVLAITRGGDLALINDEACRIFGVPSTRANAGRPYAEVLRSHPDIVRVLGGAFDMATLPNRAEIRLKPIDKVIG